jgi:hypothetical protein
MEQADEILRQMMTSPYQDVYPDTVSFDSAFWLDKLMSEKQDFRRQADLSDSVDRAYSFERNVETVRDG